MIYIFWLCILVIFYHIFGYGLLLSFMNLFKKQDDTAELIEFPSITVLCPAYNEEKHIEKKIQSFLALDYPKDKIEMIVISDDSTDNTNKIVKKFEEDYNIHLVIQKPRKGKQSGHNLVEPTIKSDLIVSTDASSILHRDSINYLVRSFQDEKVGLVAGKMILVKEGEHKSAEDLYWKYETWLRRLESKFYTNIVASGCLFAIRRQLFTKIHPASPDDFERALIVNEKGYKVIFEEQAKVEEKITKYSHEEIDRKIRIITQEWFALFRHLNLLNPFKYTEISFIIISHKLIRWLMPLFSFLILISNIMLMNKILFLIILVGQILIYLSGIIGLLFESRKKSLNFLKIQTHFLSMNYAALISIINLIKKKQFSIWETQ